MRKHSDCYQLARQWRIERAKLELKLLEGEFTDEELPEAMEQSLQRQQALEQAIAISAPETLYDLAGILDVALSILDEGALSVLDESGSDDERETRMLRLVRDNLFFVETPLYPNRENASPEARVAH